MSARLAFLSGLLGLLALLVSPGRAASASALPAWVTEVAALPTPALPPGAPALVLLDEWAYTVENDGSMTLARRYAARVLDRSGMDYAACRIDYVEGRDTVKETNAWLVRAGREVKPPKKREWADVSGASSGAIYDEARLRGISYGDLACVGDVFASETRIVLRRLFGQIVNEWDTWLPTLTNRCILRLPPGWVGEALLAGPEIASLKATVEGQTRSWELRDRPYRPDEPAMADGARLDAVVRINYAPPAGSRVAAPFVPRDWAAVANWDWNNSLGATDSDASLKADALKLTAGCTDSFSRVRALSGYVQQLRYVGVNKDIGIGRGYRPRKATEVHAKGWGDCKDKANLLVAMLREVGVEAFLVTVRSGGGRLVNPGWPSLTQFNHAIVGIRADDSMKSPAVAEAAGVGRLLFFDATDPDVLAGDLPWYLQGTPGYVVAPGTVGLTTLPNLPADPSHRFERNVRMALAADGSVSGECGFWGLGEAGAFYRAKRRRHTAKELRTEMSERINETVRGAVVDDCGGTDDPATGECRIRFGFKAPHFGQPLPGGLTLVRLDVLNRDAVPSFAQKDRKLPVGLYPAIHHDEVRLQLPSGCVVDEMPEGTELGSRYGSYQSRYAVDGGSVVFERTLTLNDCTVPVNEYAALRQFLAGVAKADRAALVLRCAAPPAAAVPAAH